jgi:hypothetical protein
MEHRWGRRIDCRIPVVIEAVACAPVSAQINNLSLSGAFVRLSIPEYFPPTIFVRLQPPNATLDHPHRIIAYVVRRTREGMGLEWDDFAPHAIRLHFELPAAEPQIKRPMHITVHDRRLTQALPIS